MWKIKWFTFSKTQLGDLREFYVVSPLIVCFIPLLLWRSVAGVCTDLAKIQTSTRYAHAFDSVHHNLDLSRLLFHCSRLQPCLTGRQQDVLVSSCGCLHVSQCKQFSLLSSNWVGKFTANCCIFFKVSATAVHVMAQKRIDVINLLIWSPIAILKLKHHLFLVGRAHGFS